VTPYALVTLFASVTPFVLVTLKAVEVVEARAVEVVEVVGLFARATLFTTGIQTDRSRDP